MGRVAWAAADDQRPALGTAEADLVEVVGGQVGRGMGGPSELGHPWAPVAHGGAVGGHGLAPSPGLIGPLALWSTSGLGTLALGRAARGACTGRPQPRHDAPAVVPLTKGAGR